MRREREEGKEKTDCFKEKPNIWKIRYKSVNSLARAWQGSLNAKSEEVRERTYERKK